MSIFLVDYENVSLSGLDGIEKLKEEDQVYIFYGNSAGSISFDMHAKIAQSRALVRYIKIERSGKNYLDFQLATLSGYLVATTAVTDFIIISKDTGFESVMDFWNQNMLIKQECRFKRWERISGRSEQKKESATNRQGKRPKKNRENKKNNHTILQEHPEEKKENLQEDMQFPQETIREMNLSQQETAEEEKEEPAAVDERKENRLENVVAEEKICPIENVEECIPNRKPDGAKEELMDVRKEDILLRNTEIKQEQNEQEKNALLKNEDEASQNRKEKKRSSMKLEERYKKEIRELVRQDCHSPNDYSMIYKIIMRTNSKETFYTQMLAVFAKERGSRLYEAILPVFGRILEEKMQGESVIA